MMRMNMIIIASYLLHLCTWCPHDHMVDMIMKVMIVIFGIMFMIIVIILILRMILVIIWWAEDKL